LRYFAVGSNMDPSRMKKIRFAMRMQISLSDYNLRFMKVAYDNPRMGYANVESVSGEVVEGAFYDVLDQDLPKLDVFEGYPRQNNRIIVKVLLDDESQVETVVCMTQLDKVRNGLRPSREYLNHLLKAKDILSEAYFQKLKKVETLD
jgi:gamma-glutamylcyclotransferase